MALAAVHLRRHFTEIVAYTHTLRYRTKVPRFIETTEEQNKKVFLLTVLTARKSPYSLRAILTRVSSGVRIFNVSIISFSVWRALIPITFIVVLPCTRLRLLYRAVVYFDCHIFSNNLHRPDETLSCLTAP